MVESLHKQLLEYFGKYKIYERGQNGVDYYDFRYYVKDRELTIVASDMLEDVVEYAFVFGSCVPEAFAVTDAGERKEPSGYMILYYKGAGDKK